MQRRIHPTPPRCHVSPVGGERADAASSFRPRGDAKERTMAVQIRDEEQMMIEVVRELAREKVAPRAAEIDAKGEFPWDMKQLLADQGILAMPFPEEYGGLGSSELSILRVIEELARACATTALILCVQQLGALPIL